jgi:hypothetical protein
MIFRYLYFVLSSKFSMYLMSYFQTRSRVRLAVWISLLSMIFAVGFFVMGAFWLWHIEDREEDQVSITSTNYLWDQKAGPF